MKSSTRLDSATFQLTPTRTRCDLIISASGKSEKIASGLLNPFVAHLKIAQEQMAKGGYSIILEPDHRSDGTWFTKGIMERFVRFVSTPEILERVYTIELEIIQIEEAIVIQGNSDMGSNFAQAGDKQAKSAESTEVSKPLILDGNEEKAIVIFKPGANTPEANGHTVSEENSKVQLLKVLETRKTMLQKEQGMAFARAVAAGFDIDQMSPLISFADSFGALRLMDACKKFKELWKRKHESGQWLEIEAAEAALSSRPDFPMSTSGIILTSATDKQTEYREGMPESQVEPSSTNKDGKPPMMYQSPPGQQEYLQGQYPHHLYPPWPINSPQGALPFFQAYPVQGMPYYPNYAGNSPFFHPHYPVTEDSQVSDGKRMRHRRLSMDGRDSSLESESQEVNASKTRMYDDVDSEEEASEDFKKAGRSGKRKSGTVVIRNINYIASKRHSSSGSETESLSESQSGDGEDLQLNGSETKHILSKRKGNHIKVGNQSDIPAKMVSTEEDGHWQAFQNLLLRDANEDKHHVDQSMFTMEKEAKQKRRQNKLGDDPLVMGGRDRNEIQRVVTDMDTVSGRLNRISRASNDELLLSGKLSGDGRGSRNSHLNVQATELDGGRNGYRRSSGDDLMVYGQKSHPSHSNAHLDPLSVNGYDNSKYNFAKSSSHNLDDDSYIVPLRSNSSDAVGKEDRNAVDMDSEIPSSIHRADNMSNRVATYEPDELILMPKRETENRSAGYDPASEYEMQARVGNAVALGKEKDEITDVRQGTKKLDKDRKPKSLLERKAGGPIRKGKPSKLSPIDDARARAEKLRAYKADLQKMKKEKEEEAMKRIEALKRERQKRIAARGNSTTVQSSLPLQQPRKQLPTKMSPNSQKGSKFSDSDPGPSSPLQRFSIKTSIGSNDSNKAAKPSRLSGGNHSAGNRLSQSVPSLTKLKKENSDATNDKKVSMARIRRLSEPKVISSNSASSVKRSIEPALKAKVTNESESKKRISAILNLDKSKAATLPELKIRTSNGPGVLGNSAAKETTQRMNKNNFSVSEGVSKDRNDAITAHQSEVDDNPVIEKTVVMLECEKPYIPSDPALQENLCDSRTYSKHKMEGKTDIPLEFSDINAPTARVIVSSVNWEPIQHQSPSQLHSHEVTTGDAEKKTLKLSSPNTTEKSYQAPHARVSSFEDPCTAVSEYGKATPSVLEGAVSGTDTAKAYVTDYGNSQLEKIPEALEKTEVKKSSKGLRLLLKFGRKNHGSATGEHNDESEYISINGSESGDFGTNTSSLSEVPTLKNLISQDETSTDSKTHKASRPFSLLSPFRSKNSEKKQTT